MQGYTGGKATDHYLAQRIQGASPEQIAAMLLEGGQRFIALALQAIKTRDYPSVALYVNRTADIILGLAERLNHEDGGEVVQNLMRIYDWWMRELFEAAQQDQPKRLETIAAQMGEFKATWEELHQRKTSGGQPPKAPGSLDDLSV